jgi:Transcriptional regulator, AbiEi antitoxin
MISGSVGDELVGLPAAFRFAEVRAAGVPESRLRRWLADGSVERVGRGLYRRVDAELVDVDRFEVASRSAAATICLVSGLVEHDLVDDNPPVLDVAVPRGAWRPQVAAAVRWHTFAVETFDLDRDIVAVDSTTSIGLYGAKRCIVDVFRLRHEVGPEVGVEALRRWLRRRGNHPGQLLDLAQHFPAALPSLTGTLQVLL